MLYIAIVSCMMHVILKIILQLELCHDIVYNNVVVRVQQTILSLLSGVCNSNQMIPKATKIKVALPCLVLIMCINHILLSQAMTSHYHCAKT